MRSIWSSLVVGLALGPGQLQGQQVVEAGPQVIVTTPDPAMLLGGVYGAFRPESRLRLAAFGGLGVQGHDLAWRVETLGHFLMSPRSLGVGVYLGGGLAVAGGASTGGFIVVLAGIESAPRWPARLGHWSWELEGGVRIGASYRWRRRVGGR